MFILIVGLILFLGIHSVRIVAPGFRDRMIAERGENAWKGIYTLVSFVGFGLIIWGFSLARFLAPILYTPPMWMAHVTLLLMLFSFILLAVYGMPAGKIKAAVKHPMLLAVKLWAFGHLLANGDLASVLLFGGFLVWAVADRISVKRRAPVGEEPPAETGPVRNDIAAIVAGTVVYLLFVWKLHEWLFGFPPVVL
ncbi:MAG: NnrU family protein [Hyphomicrobiales bacterium]|nr:NnrU family protein [Hyphomicrobiales bacterium]MCP4997518.1 NnrU family protein [Hyphomicrobiales bacterium]